MNLLHRAASRRARWWFSRWLVGGWCLYYLLHPFERLALLPRDYYDPVGLLRLLPLGIEAAMWDVRLLAAARVLIVAVCIGALFERWFRPSAAAACVLITLEQSFVRGFSSFMNHAEVPALLALYLLTAFAFLDRRAETRGGRDESVEFSRHGLPLFAIAAIFSLTYSTVGVTRLLYGGGEVYSGELMVAAIQFYAPQPWWVDFGLGAPLLDWRHARTLLNCGLLLTTIFEVLAPLSLVSRGFRAAFVPVIVVFHLAVLVTMQIDFLEHLWLLPVMVDLSRRLPDLPRRSV